VCSVHGLFYSIMSFYSLYTVSQKGCYQTHGGITSSNLNRFSKYFYRWKRAKFPIKRMYLFSPHLISMLPHYLGECKNSNLSQIWTYKTTACKNTLLLPIGAWCNAAKHLFQFAIPSTKFSQIVLYRCH